MDPVFGNKKAIARITYYWGSFVQPLS